MRILRRIAVSDAKYGLFGSNYRVALRSYVSSCRAVLLPRFGGPEVLELRSNVGIPDLKANEVLVRTRAVSINPLDTRVSSTHFLPILEVCL